MSTTSDPTTADILNAAADYIEEHGWSRYMGLTPEGRVCAAVAIIRVADGSVAAEREALRAMGRYIGDVHIIDWNVERASKERVILGLRAAAEIAEETVS